MISFRSAIQGKEPKIFVPECQRALGFPAVRPVSVGIFGTQPFEPFDFASFDFAPFDFAPFDFAQGRQGRQGRQDMPTRRQERQE